MPDRSLRLPPSFAYGPSFADVASGSTRGGRDGSTLLRDGGRPSSPPRGSDGSGDSGASGGSSGSGTSGGSGGSASGTSGGSGGSAEDNPFAPPPEGTPEQPWQPRRPAGGDGSGGSDGSGNGDSPWGSQWSDRQPGRSSDGGFGERPGGGQGPEGSGPGSGGQGGGMRWDPTDPAQRRARYALLSGMWAFFFALFGWRYVALLLGALGLHWAISALRAKPRPMDPTAPAPTAPAGAAGGAGGNGGANGARTRGAGGRPQTTAAISGLVTASLALAMVLATFAAQLIYRDYYTCRDDALTNQAQQNCEDLLPKELRPLLTDRD
ncbi:hypothetical protein [Streptomyces flavofungini]|uniref:Integral membrane protein n=1 Tax=Streptomyces flavofungini TaxID=68200 RepID=A0ABS0X5J5_9ACTN|nr:hypothetical protein [Streptomyces flavofungini]MBJ3808466.1 hypothetical protein [Streptomyces flavofungini]GHC69746.1 hypothetical protein GCM10010349_44800 [Streptomyces flavofungini]